MSFSPSITESSPRLLALTEALFAPRQGAFASLGGAFYTRLPAAPLRDPYVVGFSADAARLLGLDPAIASEPGFADWFIGNATREWPQEGLPYASVYSGHQFGVWAGQL